MSKKVKKVRLLVPNNLNLEELIKKTNFKFLLIIIQGGNVRREEKGLPVSRKLDDFVANFSAEKEKGKWLKPIRLKKLYWVVTKIGNKRVNDPFCFDDFVKLHSGFLQKNLGTRYATQCLLILEQLGVIVPDHFKYQVGARSRAFKLCEPYLGQKRRVIHDFEFTQKDDGEGFDEKPPEKILGVQTPFHQHLVDSLKSVTVSPCAFDYLQTLPFENDSGEIALSRLNVIKNKAWQFRIDDYDRVNTNVSFLTNSKTDANGNKVGLRRFLLLDDEPMVEVDIKASHPFHCLDLYRLVEGQSESVAAERARYGALFREDFYLSIRELSGLDVSREAVKNLWMQEILNRSRPKTKEAKALLAAFEPEFPVLVKCMRQIRAKDYRHMSHHLMRLEAKLLTHTVGRRIWEMNGAKFLTVYDSIMHKVRDTRLIRDTINAVYLEHLGLAPTVSQKDSWVQDSQRSPEQESSMPLAASF